MYQFSLAIGKSSGFEVSVLSVIPATALPEGRVGILIGDSTGKNGGHLMKLAAIAAEALLGELRTLPGSDQYSAQVLPATELPSFGAVSTGSDASVGAAINATPAQAGQSALVANALTQCLEVAREYLNSGLALGIPA